MRATRILVVDDHKVVRDGLREMLRPHGDLEIVAEAGSGPEAIHQIERGGIDLMILDISLPGFSGVRVLQYLSEAGLKLPTLFFSMYPPEQYAASLRKMGARGFLGKNADNPEIVRTIRKIINGESHFPSLRKKTAGASSPKAGIALLTDREREVMLGIVRGENLKRIASRLEISAKTVSTYRTRVLTKLNVENNAELIAFANRMAVFAEIQE